MNEHEAGFLHFVSPPQQRRLRTLLELGERRRAEVRALLDHSLKLEPRFVQALEGGQQFRAPVERLLKSFGAPEDCFVLSANLKLDGQEMALSAALDAVIGQGDGAFVSCVPGKLGFYQFAEANGGRLLRR